MTKTKLMKDNQAISMGYSADKRKRKNQHRTCSKEILKEFGFFARGNQRGTTMNGIALWHLSQAYLLTLA